MTTLSSLKIVSLFPGKSLWGAFLVSFLWHLLCIRTITIIPLQPAVQFPRFSEVAFLGSILREPDFEIQLSKLPFSRRPEEVTRPYLQRSGRLLDASLVTPGRWVASTYQTPLSLAEGLPLYQKLFLRQKATPRFSTGPSETPLDQGVFRFEGPGSQRTLYYRPKRPQLPRWIDPREVRAELKFKFWISPEGKVRSVEKLISSGNPKVDMIGIRYLRRWQFSPKRGDSEWAVVSFPLKVPSDGKKGRP